MAIDLELEDREDSALNLDEKADQVQHASDIIGDWGPVQRNVVIFYIGICVIAAFNNLGIAFYAPKIDFWCKRPPGYENASAQTCSSYEDITKPCIEWEYDMSFYRSTIVNEFNLVCDREWLASASASVLQIGYGVSSLAIGFLSDRCGRLVAFKTSICLELVFGLLQGVSQNIWQFLIARLFLGIGAYGRFLSGALLILELVGPKFRDRVQVAIEIGWCFGYLILPLVHYFVRHFRYVQLMVFVYETLFLFGLWKLPESPRWQLTHGRFTEAEKTITTAALMSGKLSEKQIKVKLLQLKNFVEKEDIVRLEEPKKTIVDLWRVPILLKSCLVLYFVWFSTMFLYYGFAYNVGSIGGSLHVNVFLQAMADSLITAALYFTINRCPRKTLAISLTSVGAIATFLIIPFTFSEGGIPYRMVLAMIGKMCVIGVGGVRHLVSVEIFPTTLRQVGVGSCSVVGRIGSTMAPFVKEIANATHLSVMMGLFGVLSTCTSIVMTLLPETRGREIPDTIEEAKEQQKKPAILS